VVLKVSFYCSAYLCFVVRCYYIYSILIIVACVKSSFNAVILLYDCEQVPVVSINMLSCLNMLSISFYSLALYISIL